LIAAALFERSLNHLLRQNPGTMELLRRHAGQTLRFDLPVGQFDFRIADDGGLNETASESLDAIIRPTAAMAARLPFFGREALRHADYSGDAALLATLDKVFRHLDWDIEADLAPLVGDIAAHRLTQTARETVATLSQASQSLQTSVAEYWIEEIEQLARRVDVERFNREVDTLVDDVARLEARLARLELTR
jgi:ubiquinone biosynthesis protein UbiJ